MTGIVHLGPKLSVNCSPLCPIAPSRPPLQNPNPSLGFPEPNVHLIKARLNPLSSVQNRKYGRPSARFSPHTKSRCLLLFFVIKIALYDFYFITTFNKIHIILRRFVVMTYELYKFKVWVVTYPPRDKFTHKKNSERKGNWTAAGSKLQWSPGVTENSRLSSYLADFHPGDC